MKIYRVESHWSKELVVANSITEAVKKYQNLVHNIERDHTEIHTVQLLGEAVK